VKAKTIGAENLQLPEKLHQTQPKTAKQIVPETLKAVWLRVSIINYSGLKMPSLENLL
jgi:hypothetical protein